MPSARLPGTRRLRSAAAAISLTALVSGHAAAQAVTVSAVNVRAGPDRFFPTVTWVLGGTAATVHGCIDTWRWCDVTVGRDRGWVYAQYLSMARDDRKATILKSGAATGLPVVGFDLRAYWEANYAGRIWFGQAVNYQNRWDRRRPQAQ